MKKYINNIERLHAKGCGLFFYGCGATSAALDGWEGEVFDGRLLVIVRLWWRTDAEAQDTVRSAASSGAGF